MSEEATVKILLQDSTSGAQGAGSVGAGGSFGSGSFISIQQDQFRKLEDHFRKLEESFKRVPAPIADALIGMRGGSGAQPEYATAHFDHAEFDNVEGLGEEKKGIFGKIFDGLVGKAKEKFDEIIDAAIVQPMSKRLVEPLTNAMTEVVYQGVAPTIDLLSKKLVEPVVNLLAGEELHGPVNKANQLNRVGGVADITGGLGEAGAKAAEDFFKKGLEPGSIFTHDVHLDKALSAIGGAVGKTAEVVGKGLGTAGGALARGGSKVAARGVAGAVRGAGRAAIGAARGAAAFAGDVFAAAPGLSTAAIVYAVDSAIKGVLRSDILASPAKFAASASSDISGPIEGVGQAMSDLGNKIPFVGSAIVFLGEKAKLAGQLIAELNKTAERYGEYNAPIAQAQAVAEIRQTMGDVRRASEISSSMTKFIAAQSDVQQKFEDVKIRMLQLIVPAVTSLLKLVEMGMPVVDGIVGAITALLSPLTSLSESSSEYVGRQRSEKFADIEDPTSLILGGRSAEGISLGDRKARIHDSTIL